jgi:predicted metalloprotease with PDZ domain
MLAQSGVEERGAVYTKAEVVDFMLDLILRSNQGSDSLPNFGTVFWGW